MEEASKMDFVYPLWFRLLYLWMGYLVAILSAVLMVALQRWYLGMAYLLAVSLAWHILDKSLLETVPTAIQIDDRCVRLSRFRTYWEFQLTDIVAVHPNAKTMFAPIVDSWTKVEVDVNGRAKIFYLAPYLFGYPELIERISETSRRRGSVAGSVFSLSGWQMLYRWVGLATLVLGLVGLAAAGFSSRFPPAGIVVWLAILSICMICGYRSYRRTPTRLELRGSKILLNFLFGSSVEIDCRQIGSIETGSRLLGKQRRSFGGYTILLASGRTFYISAMFRNSHELLSRLKAGHDKCR